jgi:hypothetical protein
MFRQDMSVVVSLYVMDVSNMFGILCDGFIPLAREDRRRCSIIWWFIIVFKASLSLMAWLYRG